MTSALEGMNQGAMLAPALTDGLRLLTADAAIPFTQYVRLVLPLDGYVFWLSGPRVTIHGSLHITANKQQNEDETISVNRVIFTTTRLVDPLNTIDQGTMWVGEAQGVRFSFSDSGPRFKQSGLFHYVGDAVYPALQSQLVDQLPSDDTLIVSNSLPAWLAMESYNPPWLKTGNPGFTLFPSFLVPDDIPPPYGAVHIEPGETQALQAAPGLVQTATGYTHSRLASDRVRVTLYGATNDDALNFLDMVNDYSLSTDAIGIMNMPLVRDEKRTQVELGIIAMRKTIDFEVSYHQSRIRDVAVQLITSAAATFNIT